MRLMISQFGRVKFSIETCIIFHKHVHLNIEVVVKSLVTLEAIWILVTIWTWTNWAFPLRQEIVFFHSSTPKWFLFTVFLFYTMILRFPFWHLNFRIIIISSFRHWPLYSQNLIFLYNQYLSILSLLVKKWSLIFIHNFSSL